MRPSGFSLVFAQLFVVTIRDGGIVHGLLKPISANRRCCTLSTARRSSRKTTTVDIPGCNEQVADTVDSQECRSTVRRQSILAIGSAVATVMGSSECRPASAYDIGRRFPAELDASDNDGTFIDGRQRKLEQLQEQDLQRDSPLVLGPLSKLLSSGLWGSALWFLLGSRSNPLVTPLANVLYSEDQQEWLKDRNDGLFGDIPLPFLLVLAVVFVALGFGADAMIVALSEGDRNISLQLAGVSLISGGALELGRIASGEKKPTREESDRDELLTEEFDIFAEKRLLQGGNCHRTDVVRSFRRYYAKYRQPDNPECPLSDLEIEQLLRNWGRPRGLEMSSAGFFSGIRINKDADVFVSRI